MNVVVIEDEHLAVKNLQSIFNEIGNINVIATFETIAESVEWFNTHLHPDLVFMDIHLADGSAFEIFEHTNITCPVIFTTAYDEYAIKAFKVNSIDYLLKPINNQAVLKSLQKYNTLVHSGNVSDEVRKIASLFKKDNAYRRNFLIPVKSDKLVPLAVDKIAFFYIENAITYIYTYDGKKYPLEYTLDELSDSLNPADFFRVNRQFLVARGAIKDVDLWFNNRLSVNLNVTVPGKILVSRLRVTKFKDWFSNI